MSVAWRACSFCLSANGQIWSLEGKETHSRANQPGHGATVAKAISKGKSEGTGETPPHPHKGLPPKASGKAYDPSAVMSTLTLAKVQSLHPGYLALST